MAFLKPGFFDFLILSLVINISEFEKIAVAICVTIWMESIPSVISVWIKL